MDTIGCSEVDQTCWAVALKIQSRVVHDMDDGYTVLDGCLSLVHLIEQHPNSALLLWVLVMINWPHAIEIGIIVKFGVALSNAVADG